MADYPVTLSDDRISRLSNNEGIRGFTHKFKIKAADVAVATATGATDTVTVTLGATPTTWYGDKALVVISTAFAGTTALSMSVGTTSSVTAFVNSTTVKTAGVLTAVGAANANAASGSASVGLVAVFTNATGGSPSAITAGELDIYVGLKDCALLG